MSGGCYYTANLSVLRSGNSELNALNNVLCCGIVNAGIGFAKTKDDEEVEEAMQSAREKASKDDGRVSALKSDCDALSGGELGFRSRVDAAELWNNALLGWSILGISGGNRTAEAQTWLRLHRHGEVFFRIKGDFLWKAIGTARREAGLESSIGPSLSWREFRVLAAILSAKTNSYGFVFLGWEIIQARACGYHSKKLFNENKATLPPHCQPLTRSMIRGVCDKLEALGFFGRVRYAQGGVGGLMAYTVTLERAALVEAVKKWQAANGAFKAKVDSHRRSDQEAFTRKW